MHLSVPKTRIPLQYATRRTKLIDNPIHWILWSIWAATAVLTVCLALRHLGRVYQTNWYDLSTKGPLEEMEWQQIRNVIGKDPPENQPCCRWPRKWLCLHFLLFAILIVLFLASFSLIYDLDRYNVSAGAIKGFGLPAGVFTLAATALGVFYNVRLSARAKNRQEWINSVRKHIHTLIANCPPQIVTNQEYPRKWEVDLTMLELLINPGERVHRSLLAILQCACANHRHPSDKEALCELRLSTQPERQMTDNEHNARWDSEKLKATRLANVLLKREWEQVKYIR